MCGFQVIDLITTDVDKKFEPVGRLASAIIEIMHEQGGCQPHDLHLKGFTSGEVARHWHMAEALALVEIHLMEGRGMPGCAVHGGVSCR